MIEVGDMIGRCSEKHVTGCLVFGQLHLSKMSMCPLLAYLSQCVKLGGVSTRKGYCKDKQEVMAYIIFI